MNSQSFMGHVERNRWMECYDLKKQKQKLNKTSTTTKCNALN